MAIENIFEDLRYRSVLIGGYACFWRHAHCAMSSMHFCGVESVIVFCAPRNSDFSTKKGLRSKDRMPCV